MILKVSWYPNEDSISIRLSDKAFAHGKDLDDKRHIDYAADDTPIGVVLMDISNGVDISDLPDQKAIEDALDSRNIKVFA